MKTAKSLKTLAASATLAALVIAPTGPTPPSVAAHADGPTTTSSTTAATASPVRHEFKSVTHKARGKYVCGDFALRVTHGTETDTTDADLRNGVVHLSISRTSPHLMLRGSDGRTYRASVVTAAWFVLRAPDFDKPVHGLEVDSGDVPRWARQEPGLATRADPLGAQEGLRRRHRPLRLRHTMTGSTERPHSDHELHGPA